MVVSFSVPDYNTVSDVHVAFIRPVLSRMRDLSTDLLSGDTAPTDDPESVLISTAKRVRLLHTSLDEAEALSLAVG